MSANESGKSTIDDLGRPSLAEFNEKIQLNSDERGDIQKKTFTKWINSHLEKAGSTAVVDLFKDFSTGRSLLALLDVLSGQPLHPEKGRMRVHHLNNVNKAIQYLTEKCHIRLVNISSDDIVNGSPKLILGLIWSIILHYQIKPALKATRRQSSMSSEGGTERREGSEERRLMEWCKEQTLGYKKVNITNFTTSWSDGFAFNALIHSYSSELVNYEELTVLNDTEYCLIHAFQVAQDRLGVTKLLDPEDMVNPDKKSIIMYLTCLYEQLTLKPAEAVVKISPPETPIHTNPSNGISSPEIPSKMARLTPSTVACETPNADSVSDETETSRLSALIDFPTFNITLQSTLTWLNNAKQKLHDMDLVSHDVERVKLQFQEHERVMLELTRYQSNIGNLLGRGNTLLLAADLTQEQELHVRNQLTILNQQWEDLRVGAMERQASLQKSLMDLQQRQLDDLTNWLSEMETRITDYENTEKKSTTLDDVKRVFEAHQQIQSDIELEEEKVNQLQNMVVIVEDGSQDSTYQSMESLLETLGERWSAVCRWTDDHWFYFDELEENWNLFNIKSQQFDKWLSDTEKTLKESSEFVIEDQEAGLQTVKNLSSIRDDMIEYSELYEELSKLADSLTTTLVDFPQSSNNIKNKLDMYRDTWDQIAADLETISAKIGDSAVLLEGLPQDEFSQNYVQLNQWIDNSNILLNKNDLSDVDSLINDVLSELPAQQEIHQQMSAQLQIESDEVRNSKLKKISDKLEKLTEKCTAVQQKMAELSRVAHIKSELEALREILHSYTSWLETVHEISDDVIEIGKQCDHCREKLKAMKHQDERINKLYSDGQLLNEEHIKLKNNVTQFYDTWISTLKSIETRRDNLTVKLHDAPPKKYLEATESLLSWLSQVEDLLSENVLVSDVTNMEKNISLFQDLQRAISEHDIDYINKTGEQLTMKSTDEAKSSYIREQLKSLNLRWNTVIQEIENKLYQLQVNINSVKQLESQLLILVNWMEEMEQFQQSESPAVGDAEILTAQIAQSDGALEDIITLEAVVSEINEAGIALISRSEPEFSHRFQIELDKMNERWNLINEMSQEQNTKLKRSLGQSEELLDKMTSLANLYTELDPLIKSVSDIRNPDEIQPALQVIQELKDSLVARNDLLTQIQKTADEMNSCSDRAAPPQLINKIKQLESKQTSLQDRLNTREVDVRTLRENWNKLNSYFNALLNNASELEERLNTESNDELDAEDMAAETDMLESMIEGSQENSDHIKILVDWFLHNNIWTDLIENKYQDVCDRKSSSTNLAEQRVRLLQVSADTSQDLEVKLTDMEKWMSEVNGLFREWNEQDLLAGDRPEDYNMMKEEFAEKDSFLQALEEHVENFRKLNKILAADRLEEKLKIIKEDYRIAQQNFAKWQRPVDFDPKLRRTQQQLKEIDEKIYFIEIYSDEIEHVNLRLEHCEKFYTTMSEIKPDVEYVIKTGRQLVEKKQVDFPKRVNQTLDAVKAMYNRLGARITQAKADLTAASKFAEKLYEEETSLTSFITEHEKLLHDQNTFTEAWVSNTEKRFESVHPKFTMVDTILDSLQQLSEESAMDEAKQRLADLKTRWQQLVQLLAAKQRHALALKSNLGADVETFTVRVNNLISVIQSTRSSDNTQKLESELHSFSSEVENVNQLGTELLKTPGDHTQHIQSCLHDLNQIYNESKIIGGQPGSTDKQILPSIEDTVRTENPKDKGNSRSPDYALSDLRTALHQDDKYEIAASIAHCDHIETNMNEEQRQHYTNIQADWRRRRDSTSQKWHSYKLLFAQIDSLLSAMESKLDRARSDPSVISEVESEIARRQRDMNNLNEQAEEITERDTPPIDEELLTLNRRWVGVRSRLSNLQSPENSVMSQSNVLTQSLIGPTKQKYEYAIVNKNRKKSELSLARENRTESTKNIIVQSTDPSLHIMSPVIERRSSSMEVDDPPPEVPVKLPTSCQDLSDADIIRSLISRLEELHQILNAIESYKDHYFISMFPTVNEQLTHVNTGLSALEHDVDQVKLSPHDPGDDEVTQQLDRLDTLWRELVDVYQNHKRNYDEVMSYYKSYHDLELSITHWISTVKIQLSQTKDEHGEIITSSAQLIQDDLYNGMIDQQSAIHKLARTAIPLASRLEPSDAKTITDTVIKLTSEWRDVALEIRHRKPRLEGGSDFRKCLETIDEVLFWLDEAEILCTSSISYMDEESLQDLMANTQEQINQISDRKEQISYISKTTKQMSIHPELQQADKEKIGRDLNTLTTKWNKVTHSLRDRLKHLRDSLLKLQDLQANIYQLHTHLWTAILELRSYMSEQQFNQIERTFPMYNKQTSVESVGIWYREVILLYKRHNFRLTDGIEGLYKQITNKWTLIRDQIQSNRPQSDSSIEETLATGGHNEAVDADGIYASPRASVLLDEENNRLMHINRSEIPKLNFSQPEIPKLNLHQLELPDESTVPPPPPRVESLQFDKLNDRSPELLSADTPTRERTLTIMRQKLMKLDDTISNRRVNVMNIQQINETVSKLHKLKNAVQEILKQLSLFPDIDSQVSGLKTECAECQVRSIARAEELKQLLSHSKQVTQRMSEFICWLDDVEQRISQTRSHNSQVHETIDLLNQQIHNHQVLEQELRSWQDHYSVINKMTENLLGTYPEEDNSKLVSQSDSITARWNDINKFVENHSSALVERRDILSDYYQSLNKFFDWLAEIERQFENLLYEVKSKDNMKSSTWPQRCQDLQGEINSHTRTHDLLTSIGEEMLSNGRIQDKNTLNNKLDELNERWSQLKSNSINVKSQLNSNMDQWSDLIHTCQKLLEQLTSRENELIAAHPIGANLETVQKQLQSYQKWKNDLDRKSSDVQQTLASGRFFLEKEGADRRLSSASADSRIMEDLAIESSSIKSAIKNIRRHIRLLNQKWLDLHNRSDKWLNQLRTSITAFETINNLEKHLHRKINELEMIKRNWEDVNDYSVAQLPVELAAVRGQRREADELSGGINKLRNLILKHEKLEGAVDATIKQNVNTLDQRLKSAENHLDSRVTQLVSINRTLAPDVDDLLKESINRPYERSVTNTGVPYFINHDRKTTQWDHPKFLHIMSQLPNFNTTKFSAYRTAQKLRHVQKSLNLHLVRLKDVIKICQQTKISSLSYNQHVDINKVLVCLRDIYEHLADERHATNINVPLSIDLALNWLLNLYDLSRVGRLEALSLKVGLVIMCRGAVEDKFNYLLTSLNSDSPGVIDESRVRVLLTNCVQIPRILGESSSFSLNQIEPSVQSCLQQSKTQLVDSRQFLDWLGMEPQTMVWLMVFHRLATSETCKHSVKCSLCKTNPIIGIRYRCLSCHSFNMCQTCFFTGKKGKTHKLNHPMKEYYATSTSHEEMKDLSSPMRKKFSSGRYIRKHHPKGYLPVKRGDTTPDMSLSHDSTPISSPPSIHLRYDTNNSVASSHDDSQEVSTSKLELSDSDTHENIQRYAHTIDRMELNRNKNNANTPSSTNNFRETFNTESTHSTPAPQLETDEHSIISKFCSTLNQHPEADTPSVKRYSTSEPHPEADTPNVKRYSTSEPHLDKSPSKITTSVKSPIQIVMSLEDQQKSELEAMIKDLEDENRNLQSEYHRLQAERDLHSRNSEHSRDGQKQAQMIAEAHQLREHTARIEKRMKILAEHNQQLHSQLGRLRHLLHEQPSDSTGSGQDLSYPVIQSSSAHNSPHRVAPTRPPQYDRVDSISSNGSLTSTNRSPKLHGSIGELFQRAGQVGKAVGQLVSTVTTNKQ